MPYGQWSSSLYKLQEEVSESDSQSRSRVAPHPPTQVAM